MTRALLRLVALGLLLFGFERWWSGPSPLRPVDAADADEALLLCKALGDAIDRDDPVVQHRLRQNMAFLEPEGAAEAADDTIALEMATRDLVVRRRLLERMRAQLQGEPSEPTEAELRGYLSEHASELSAPPRLRLSQVFVRGDRPHGMEQARELLVRLRSGVAAGLALGDPTPWPTTLPPKSSASLSALFGPDFAAAVQALPTGEWSGPVSSPFGYHLVRIDERVPERAARFESLRPRLRAAVLAQRRNANLAAGLARLRAEDASRCAAGLPETAGGSSQRSASGEKG